MSLAWFAIPLVVIVACWIIYSQGPWTLLKHSIQTSDVMPDATSLLDSPLMAIPFSKAVDSGALTETLPRYALQRLAFDFGLDPANILIQSVSLAKEHDSIAIAYEFSKQGRRLLRSKSAIIPLEKSSGRLLPTLQDAETRKFIETAKGRPINPSHLAKVSSIVVSAAHIISGMDVVRRLDGLDRKLDSLLHGRKIDQRAELEKIYQMARERLSAPRTEMDRQEMLRWRGELYKLRSSWRQGATEFTSSELYCG